MPHDYIPGVPAAGHLSDRGFWHPGRARGCVKCVDPARCERAETTRDCPLNHHWYGKEARHR